MKQERTYPLIPNGIANSLQKIWKKNGAESRSSEKRKLENEGFEA
jgi:hypothetical protein